MNVAICVLAKDEAASIGGFIADLRAQSIFERGWDITIHIVANGCTDDTAGVAQQALETHFGGGPVRYHVADLERPGKARAWNTAVHDLIGADAELAIFADADIEFVNRGVVAELCDDLLARSGVLAVSGYPLKDIAKKDNKSIIDRFSLAVSKQTPAEHALNGSLYVAYMAELRKIWLPVPTPGEDGMISAMLHTNGFSEPVTLSRVHRAEEPTHYFEAHSVAGFFKHERRMTVGTVINGWIFEWLWAGQHKEHVGEFIRQKNESEGNWVNRLIADHVGDRKWVLPPRMLSWRLRNLRNAGLVGALAKAPFSIAATALNLWPSVLANETLKKENPAGHW